MPGASSYKITVATQSSPNIPIAFATFGPNTVMGSVNSLSPDIEYIFAIEALDNSQAALTSATLVSASGDVHLCLFLFCLMVKTIKLPERLGLLLNVLTT